MLFLKLFKDIQKHNSGYFFWEALLKSTPTKLRKTYYTGTLGALKEQEEKQGLLMCIDPTPFLFFFNFQKTTSYLLEVTERCIASVK